MHELVPGVLTTTLSKQFTLDEEITGIVIDLHYAYMMCNITIGISISFPVQLTKVLLKCLR